MNVTFRCVVCDNTSRIEFTEATTAIACPNCDAQVEIPAGSVSGRSICRCLYCPSEELYVRKNFSQRLGLLIIITGFLASCVTWFFHMFWATFGILFATALLDVIVYFRVGNLLQCYRCNAEYRDIEGVDDHTPFSLETHERFRQQAARLAEANHAPTPTTKSTL